jgi:uncharacterized protein YggE
MTSRVSGLSIVVLAFLVAACGAPATTYVTSSSAPIERTISVSGTARVELVPDEACVELTLAARDAAMPAAHERLTRDVEGLLGALAGDDALRVERGVVRYSPNYESDAQGRSRLVGHVATAQLNVRVRDFGRIPEVVGHAASRGLDRVDVVFYSTELVARKAEVRRQALEAARDKARAMAETLGVSLGEVVTIVEGGASTNARIEVANYVAAARTDAVPDAPPVPGSIPLTIDVSVVYRLE